jgi:predicted glycogen debranching enzyme
VALIDWGREVCGVLGIASMREWLCTNGIGGFASGTVAGMLTRRYHGLLVAALAPPLGRTLLVSKLEEDVDYGGVAFPLAANQWADSTVDPNGYRQLERFRLEGTTPVWSYACADALLEKTVWMEQGANTTYVRYRLLRAQEPLRLTLRVLVNYRDYHATTRSGGWRMDAQVVPRGLRVVAFDGAQPILVLAEPGDVAAAHDWYRAFALLRERERGLDYEDDHLHAGTIRCELPPGGAVTVVLSAEANPSLDGEAAWARRQAWEADVLRQWRARRTATPAPAWVEHLALAADQFIVRRPLADDPGGMTVIAGYHWFGDWGRDTMISLPGLALTTGRPEIARQILRTFARFVDRGILPNRFPDSGETAEYNTADATLWYFEAIRQYHEATGDDGLVKELYPVLEGIVAAHRQGTHYRIGEDPADGLIRAGEPGVQLTWMDAKVGDWVVTPRIGKPVEINALWYNALRAMAGFAAALERPAEPWTEQAERVARGFERFWNESAGYCYDVIDGPGGADAALRPNQIFAVSLPASPLSPERQRRVVDACARHLLTSYGLRSLAPGHADYRGWYGGDQRERDGSYHQGTVWGWLLAPFALAHFKVHGDARTALDLLAPIAHHLADYGVGSVAEIFDGTSPFRPGGCIAQAWSVAETLRAWAALAEAAAPSAPAESPAAARRPGATRSPRTGSRRRSG